MAKSRSPDYPAIGLREGIERVRRVYESGIYRSPVSKQVFAEHMGYKSLSGASLPVLSALSKYGLIEGRANDTRISEMGVAIIAHPPGDPERARAIRDAASRPELFAELDARYEGGRTTDQAIRGYLLTRGFIPPAADTAIRAYRETKTLVDEEPAAHNDAAQIDSRPQVEQRQTEPVTRAPADTAPGMARQQIERAQFPLQEGLATVELPRNLSEDSYQELVEWMRVVLRKTRRMAMAGRIPESALVLPALECIYEAGGKLSTAGLIDRLEKRFQPEGEDLEILDGRADTKFSQKVRNLKSHKTLEKAGYAIEVDDGFELTDAGRTLVESTRP